METNELDVYDAHCHLYAYGELEDVEHVLNECERVRYIVENATFVDNFDRVIQLGKKYPHKIIPSVGIHPMHYDKWDSETEQIMRKAIEDNENCMVGEIGLDFKNKDTDKKKQVSVFLAQLAIAVKHNRSASIHSVRSHGEMLKSLKKVYKQEETSPKHISLIMHSFSGPCQIMKSMLKLSDKIYFSFSLGCICDASEEVLREVPLCNVLVETDSPYQLSKDVYGVKTVDNKNCKDIEDGLLNTPDNVYAVLLHIAKVKGVDVNEVVTAVASNFKRAFMIHK